MAQGQRCWTALASGMIAMTMGLLGWASGGKAKHRVSALRGGQPDDLATNRGDRDRNLWRQRLNEAANRGRRPGTRGISAQTPVLRLVGRLRLTTLLTLAAFLAASGGAIAAAPTLTTLVVFNGTDGAIPQAGLIADAAGNLFGTTSAGGEDDRGTVFEIAKTSTGYASTPTTLVSFNNSNGADPDAPLIADSAGNLFGTTFAGDTVFELVDNEAGSYTLKTLASLGYSGAEGPGALAPDTAGDLFGMTENTVFELVNNGNGSYTLVTLANGIGAAPGSVGGLIAAAGELFGINTDMGNAGGKVFEIAKTGTGYASTPTTLATLPAYTLPIGPLIADAAGDLFGTTAGGGAYGDGSVFELVNNGGGSYTLTTLVSFNGADGGGSGYGGPNGGLIMDAAGNLFGTTQAGGAVNNGTVFEVAKSGSSYASTPIILTDFSNSPEASPVGSLLADAAGNLFGVTYTGGSGVGTVFELSGAGVPLSKNPQTADFDAAGRSDILWQNTNGQAAIWLMDGTKAITTASVGANPGTSWRVVGAGDFYGSLYSDILWQNTDGGDVAIWEMNGTTVVASGSPGNPGSSWHAIATGDFNCDGKSDILWQSTNGAVAIWEMNGLKVIASATIGNPGTSWHVIGSGDFNGDGYSDILWQNANGEVDIWEMNGLKVIASAVVGNPGTSWHAIGSGDFYGNGYSDILWQNTNGAVAIWEMNGLKEIASTVIGNPGTSWHVIGSGDFYGSGFSDILWQNTNGEVDIWEMDGTKVIDTGSPGNPGAGWQAIGECPATRFAPCIR